MSISEVPRSNRHRDIKPAADLSPPAAQGVVRQIGVEMGWAKPRQPSMLWQAARLKTCLCEDSETNPSSLYARLVMPVWLRFLAGGSFCALEGLILRPLFAKLEKGSL